MTSPVRTSWLQAFGKAVAFAGFDADVLHTFVFRSWSIVAGGATVLLVTACLSGVQQGYYYTFASLLTLQIFFDLGMNQVILQLVSHNVAREGHVRNQRLGFLVALVRRWYAAAAAGFFLAVSAGGAWFLHRNAALAPAQWLGPWVALTLATAANLFLGSMLAVLEGAGNVADVARLRFRQSVLGYAAMWIGLAVGAGLWATVLIPFVTAVYSWQWLRLQRETLRQTRAAASEALPDLPSWRRDVFPLQWRLALSWIGGYFVFQLLTPLAFARQGAVEAGRLGITLAVFNAVLTAGMSWVNAKFPTLAMHLARKERPQANTLFQAVARRAMAFTALVCIAVLVALAVLHQFAPSIGGRFSALPVAACVAVVTLANTFIFAAASYLRAHKEEPMLWISLVSGLAVVVAVGFGSRLGVLPMMALYMAVTVLLPLPWTFMLFLRYYRRPA